MFKYGFEVKLFTPYSSFIVTNPHLKELVVRDLLTNYVTLCVYSAVFFLCSWVGVLQLNLKCTYNTILCCYSEHGFTNTTVCE